MSSEQISTCNEVSGNWVLSIAEQEYVDPIDYKERFSIPMSDISFIGSEEYISGITIDRHGDLYCLLRLTKFENQTNVPYCRLIKITTNNQGEIEEILKETRGTLVLQNPLDGRIRLYNRRDNLSYVYDPRSNRITSHKIPFKANQLQQLSSELVASWPTGNTSLEDSRGVSTRIQSYRQIGNIEIAIGRISGRISESAIVVVKNTSGEIDQVASDPVQTNIMISDANFPVPSTSGSMPIRLPFFPVPSATIWGDDRVVISSGLVDELNVHDLLGNLIERIVVDIPLPVITVEDSSNYKNEYIARPQDEELSNSQQAWLKYRYESIPLPTNKPYWRQIMGDDSSLLWLRKVTRDGNVLTLQENYRDTYLVLDPKGDILFQTTVPPGVQFSDQQELAIPIAISLNSLGRVEWDQDQATHLIKVYEIIPVDSHLKEYLEQLWKLNH